jgi:RNA polymerase sigma-70 factor (ECF subfamily)
MTQRRPAPAPCDRPCAGLCRPDGFAAAHREYRRRLVARARAVLGDPESAEDAVQEAFLRAWAACSAFDPTAGPTLLAWLSTITRNVVVDLVRARAARPQLPRTEPDPGDAARGGSSVTPIDTALLRLQLLDALASVSAEHRGVVLRTVLRDRSYRDVAAELELPVGTVRSRAHYALRGLRRSLERADLAA